MFEEVLEVLGTRWGLIGLGALLLVSGPGRKVVRSAAKSVIKAGMDASDSAREFVAELKEQGGDLIAEVQSERKEAMQEELKPAASAEKKSKKSAE
ncbi:MAG: hypothetical protein K2X27_07330 [Candidatus Obscuribacterales bacterium]|nr:hypothetical protein [Candidatus Obscuribacterales bacterium]